MSTALHNLTVTISVPSNDDKVEEAPSASPRRLDTTLNSSSPTPPVAANNANLHPVIRIMQEQELGKGFIAVAVPVAMAIVAAGKDKHTQSWMNFILVLLCVGIAAIFSGILLRKTFHIYAPISEAVGIALVVTAFFAVIAVYLPAELSWVPVVCICLCLQPFGFAVWQLLPN